VQRESLKARAGWERKVEELGLSFHTIAGDVYWDESACYRFTSAEVDKLEAATAELHERALEAVGRVIEKKDFARFQIPEPFHQAVAESWRDEEPSLYGRMASRGTATASPGSSNTTPTRPRRSWRQASCSGTGCRR